MNDVLLAGAWTLNGDTRTQALYVLTLACLVLGTALTAAALRHRRLDVLAVAVAGAGVASWLLSNQAMEGVTLLVVAPGNGLTSADLIALPAVGLVGLLSWRRLREDRA